MNERSPLRYTVALLGFDDPERAAFAGSFRLAEPPTPDYTEVADAQAAAFLIVNADQPAEVSAVRAANRLRDTVFIGAQVPTGALAVVPRPVEPFRILRALNLLLEHRLWARTEPARRPRPATRARTAGRRSKDVLVVDDSRVALRFMQVRLERRGYHVQCVQTAEQAVQRLAEQAFSLVFADVDLGPAGMDGLSLCQHIKQGRHGQEEGVPRVVIVTSLGTSSDRVRGALAGCDAYLTKPLMDDDLAHALRLLDPPTLAA